MISQKRGHQDRPGAPQERYFRRQSEVIPPGLGTDHQVVSPTPLLLASPFENLGPHLMWLLAPSFPSTCPLVFCNARPLSRRMRLFLYSRDTYAQRDENAVINLLLLSVSCAAHCACGFSAHAMLDFSESSGGGKSITPLLPVRHLPWIDT